MTFALRRKLNSLPDGTLIQEFGSLLTEIN